MEQQSVSAFSEERLHFLSLLAREYPTVQDACTEIINLQAILNLPKGTEHFISDIHGEYDAFRHLMNSCSGVIREKLEMLFDKTTTRAERDELATLIYYPEEKMKQILAVTEDPDEWFRMTLYRLLTVCRTTCSKYTRSKVRKALPHDYAYVLDELLHTNADEENKQAYYENIVRSIIEIGQAPAFIQAVCTTIKRTAVDHLHVVGDLFDRGPRSDRVLDELQNCRRVDIQWGNHDVLWMGAASGSEALVCTVIANALHYHNIAGIETGYGISLRPLSIFANEVYHHTDIRCFKVNPIEEAGHFTEKDRTLAARMYKAISIILFKLEGQLIARRPEFGMDDRRLLRAVDFAARTVTVDGITYPMEDTDLPTVDPADPERLTEEERAVLDQLCESFRRSEKLQQHIRFLYAKGGIYKIFNGNLLLHGCIPMDADGEFLTFTVDGVPRRGRDFLDYCDTVARRAYYADHRTPEKAFGLDFLWYLWAGRNSPVFGRDRLTTFERRFIRDENAWVERKNPYYHLYNDPAVCDKVLAEFGLSGDGCHIINGHVPVKTTRGDSPVKGGGKLIVIDGGFCKAYQATSGIAGYTLIANSHCLRIVAHHPFAGKAAALTTNRDVANDSFILERMDTRVKIAQTDNGRRIRQQIDDLMDLLAAYRTGTVPETHKEG